MSDNDTLLFKSDFRPFSGFSKMPVIRTFNSLMTDEEFQSAGLKIEHHPNKKASFIYPAVNVSGDEHENAILSDTLISARHVVSPKFLYVDASCVRDSEINLSTFMGRLEELRTIAEEEEVKFNENSASEAIEWLQQTACPRAPYIFLVNNGNVRLLWKNQDIQLGVQFLGDGSVQFVFLGKNDQAERIFGSIKRSELLKRILGLDLSSLLGFDHNECPSRTVKTSFDTSAHRTFTTA